MAKGNTYLGLENPYCALFQKIFYSEERSLDI